MFEKEKEIWKPFPENERYLVSNLGRIKNSETYKVLRPTHTGKKRCQYLSVFLSYRNGKQKTHKVHRMVLQTFEPIKDNTKMALHINGNRYNNTLKNLKWGDAKENAQDAIRHGTIARGERGGKAKLKEEDVIWIRKKAGIYSQNHMAKIFNVTKSCIAGIVKKRNWKHIK